ncbi:IS66 family insertion sequence element accessory protein TnpA [Marinomonas sp. TI.3.20]
MDDQAESGLSAPQYCAQHQVSYACFSKWRSIFRELKPRQILVN